MLCSVRDGDIEKLFCRENQCYPLSLFTFGELRSGTKAVLVKCFEETHPTPPEQVPEMMSFS